MNYGLKQGEAGCFYKEDMVCRYIFVNTSQPSNGRHHMTPRLIMDTDGKNGPKTLQPYKHVPCRNGNVWLTALEKKISMSV